MTETIIAIGSNMGDRENYIKAALDQIETRAGHILASSDILETKAYGVTDQADFLNLAIRVETRLRPRQLLDVLHEIEAELDRVRVIRWGPRTIDLDIIFYGDQILDEEDLHIPHIDMYNRDFVLGPIAQIAPQWLDPRTGKTVAQLREALLRGEPAQAEVKKPATGTADAKGTAGNQATDALETHVQGSGSPEETCS